MKPLIASIPLFKNIAATAFIMSLLLPIAGEVLRGDRIVNTPYEV